MKSRRQTSNRTQIGAMSVSLRELAHVATSSPASSSVKSKLCASSSPRPRSPPTEVHDRRRGRNHRGHGQPQHQRAGPRRRPRLKSSTRSGRWSSGSRLSPSTTASRAARNSDRERARRPALPPRLTHVALLSRSLMLWRLSDSRGPTHRQLRPHGLRPDRFDPYLTTLRLRDRRHLRGYQE